MTAFIDKFQRYTGFRSLAWLILINAAMFLAVWTAIAAGSFFGMSGNFTMPWLCVSSDPMVFITHPWTALTYMVTHYEFLHFLFNVLWLYWFGTLLYTRVSDRQFTWLYVFGGVVGAVCYVAVTAFWPELQTPGGYLCGASASVLAIMTTAAILSPDREIRLFLFGNVKLKWVAVVCIALTFLGLGGGNPGAQSAHVGGVAAGALFPFIFLGRGKSASSARQKKPFEAPSGFRKIRINVKRDGNAVAQAAAKRLSDAERLDQLLDKIRQSGYRSLSAGERNELNLLSQRIDKIHSNNPK